MAPEELEIGPSVLEPGPPKHPDALARALIWPLLALLFIATIIFYVLFVPMKIVGDSMLPTLLPGERILRTKSYSSPVREDIVIIDTTATGDPEDIVKRVVAVEGDTIEIVDDIAYVNGRKETSKGKIIVPAAGLWVEPLVVPKGHVYVLGDNRPISLDSRMFGPIPLKNVLGKAVFVFAPVYAIHGL
jgi:signal peptidase I